MWITQNNKIWYSESEYKELEQENKELKEAINHKFQNYWHKIEMKNFEVNKINLEYKQALEEIREIASHIITDEDKPACLYEADCPANGGEGYDNHCNEHCPLILAKEIRVKIDEVLK